MGMEDPICLAGEIQILDCRAMCSLCLVDVARPFGFGRLLCA
jgi:hypothetical protein